MKKSRLTAIFTILCMLFASVSVVSSAEESKNDNPNLYHPAALGQGAKTQSLKLLSVRPSARRHRITALRRQEERARSLKVRHRIYISMSMISSLMR